MSSSWAPVRNQEALLASLRSRSCGLTIAISNAGMKRAIRNLILILAIISGLAFIEALYAGSKVAVAIIDSPVDLVHPEIQAAIDAELLQQIEIPVDGEKEMSLFDLNELMREQFKTKISEPRYRLCAEFLTSSAILRQGGGSSQDHWRVLIGRIRYRYSEAFRRDVNAVSTYLHGTHVAGIVAKSFTDVSLITIPILEPSFSKRFGVLKAIKASIGMEVYGEENFFQLSRDRKMEAVSEAIRKANVQVVNLSLGSEPATRKQTEAALGTAFGRMFLSRRLTTHLTGINNRASLDFISDITTLIERHPKVVFVMAAGNESVNLNEHDRWLARLRAPNLIKVGALDTNGKLAGYSNYSPSYVDIAAPGSFIPSARAEGGEILMSGSSMAAPYVTQAVARILSENPTFTPAQVFEELYRSHSVSDGKLANAIAEGRKLVLPNKLRIELAANGHEAQSIWSLTERPPPAYLVPPDFHIRRALKLDAISDRACFAARTTRVKPEMIGLAPKLHRELLKSLPVLSS